jgi:hypothetical protein
MVNKPSDPELLTHDIFKMGLCCGYPGSLAGILTVQAVLWGEFSGKLGTTFPLPLI